MNHSKGETQRWFVCFCEPAKSIELTAQLVEEGITAECPWYIQRRRVPRRNRIEKIKRPAIAGIFFVGTEHWPLAHSPHIVAGVDLFEVHRLQVGGYAQSITDEELDPLREWCELENNPVHPKANQIPTFSAGDECRILLGPFADRNCTVTTSKDDLVQVVLHQGEFERLYAPLKISPFLLRLIQA